MKKYPFARMIHFLKSNPIILIFFILFIGDSIVFPRFFSFDLIENLLRATSTTGIVVIGMTLVILCSDIDLSVGSVLAISGVIFAHLITKSFLLAVISCLAAGLVCGMVTGMLTVKAKIPAFIATLSTQYAIRGVVYIVTKQQAVRVSDAPTAFDYLGNGSILGFVPFPAVLFIAFGIVTTLVLKRTTFGRSIYATGSNMEAANMMGIRTPRVRMMAFVISGVLSAIAGMITTSRLGAAQAVAGEDLEMTVIASIVLGGVLLRGGVGEMYNAMFGALFLRLLTTTFNNIPSISTYWQTVITGICLLGVVFSQNYLVIAKKKIRAS